MYPSASVGMKGTLGDGDRLGAGGALVAIARRCFMPALGVSSCMKSSVPGEAPKREDIRDPFETTEGALPRVTPGGNGRSSASSDNISNEEMGDRGLATTRPL